MYYAAAEAALLSGGPPIVPATTRRPVQMPDEYLPPNKLLFVQNLTDEMDKASLVALFQVLVYRLTLCAIR